jgi:diacylglycerol kinase (ATP)
VQGKKLTRHFCNYFSFGIDGEIGYEFDKRRTSTRLGNLAMYGMMGIKTGLQKIKNLGELVEIMSYGEETVFEGNNKGMMDYVSNPFCFNFGDFVEGVKKINSFHNNQNLLALNINSFMGGVTDIWKKAKENESIRLKNNPTEPSHSDGKLEFVSFSDSGKIGLEKTLGNLDVGFAERIIQGEGPFYIKFREYPNDADHRTFLQIDG